MTMLCKCGCGGTLPEKPERYPCGVKRQPTRFLLGHHIHRPLSDQERIKHAQRLKGIKRSEQTRKRISKSKLGNKNPEWKGDCVRNAGLHKWVRNYLPRPELCQMCNINKPHDLANITGNYNRGLDNWKYLCRRCHMLSDGRMNNLYQYRGMGKE